MARLGHSVHRQSKCRNYPLFPPVQAPPPLPTRPPVKPEEGGLWTISVHQEGRYGWQACGWERVEWDDLLDVDDEIMKLVRPMRREIRRVEAAE